MSKVTSLIRWRHAPPQEVGRRTYIRSAASRLDRTIGGVNSCEAGSRMLRDPIRCSLQMLRQIKAGVKLSGGSNTPAVPGNKPSGHRL